MAKIPAVREDLKKRVLNIVQKHNLIEKEEKILVGFSGGGDSLALLHILLSLPLNLKIFAFHLNHLLRGEESFRDEKKVKEICNEFSLPLFLERRDILKERKKGESLEEAARRVRFKVMGEIAKKERIRKIALGHHLDDQVETFLFRLLKGTSLSGLSVMRLRSYRENLEIIRPLLPFPRREIEIYLEKESLLPIQDSSNFDLKIPRNFIRHKVIPLLEEVNPHFREKIYSLTQLIQNEEDYFSSLVSGLIKDYSREEKIIIPLKEISSFPFSVLYRLIKEIFSKAGEEKVSLGRIEEVKKVICSPRPNLVKKFTCLQLLKDYDRIIFSPLQKEEKISYEYLLSCPGEVYIPEIKGKIKAGFSSKEDVDFSNNYKVFLDARRINFPLVVRTRKPGDRFYPLGSPGRKKLKDFFIEKKIPLKKRDSIPLVLSGEEIIWVVGIEISHLFRVKKDTSRIVSLTFENVGFGNGE